MNVLRSITAAQYTLILHYIAWMLNIFSGSVMKPIVYYLSHTNHCSPSGQEVRGSINRDIQMVSTRAIRRWILEISFALFAGAFLFAGCSSDDSLKMDAPGVVLPPICAGHC